MLVWPKPDVRSLTTRHMLRSVIEVHRGLFVRSADKPIEPLSAVVCVLDAAQEREAGHSVTARERHAWDGM